MAIYFDRASVEAVVPQPFLLQALDDDADQVEDAGLWDAIAQTACDSVDAYLGGRHTVPFAADAIPALATEAARIFALEALYQRRGYSKDTDPPNPWIPQADAIRARLKRIAAGDEPLAPDLERGVPAIATVTEPSRTTSSQGRMGY